MHGRIWPLLHASISMFQDLKTKVLDLIFPSCSFVPFVVKSGSYPLWLVLFQDRGEKPIAWMNAWNGAQVELITDQLIGVFPRQFTRRLQPS